MTTAPWLAVVACKAVLSAQEALPCRSLELDLTIADDGAWVLAHDPVQGTTEQLAGKHQGFDAFVAGLKGKRFEHVNLDIKTRGVAFGKGRLTGAFERHAPALEKLAAQADHVVASSPIPGRYEEVERWALAAKSKVEPGFELADYSVADAKGWGVPLSRTDALLLPLGRLMNRLYLWWRGAEIRWLFVQERTAERLTAGPRRTIVCWTRDPVSGPPPAACRWTQRRKG